MLTEESEKNRAWKHIWYLENGYYDQVEKAVRDDLKSSLLDFLDTVREKETKQAGGTFGPRDETPTDRGKAGVVSIPSGTPLHDPSIYLFEEGSSWIPWALDATSGAKRGRYAKGYPEGLVVHWTAGHRNGLDRGNNLMRSTGMLYLLMDEHGKVAQSDSLAHWGYHGGSSSHPSVSGTVSNEFAGVEIQAAGQLARFGDLFYPWWDRVDGSGKYQRLEKNAISARHVANVTTRRDNIAPGHYHAYTASQIVILRALACWLYLNRPDVFSIDRVVGHDEVSPGRKVDPGGAIYDSAEVGGSGHIFSMPEFRQLLWNDVDRIVENRKKKAA